jgi:hypothetical protein
MLARQEALEARLEVKDVLTDCVARVEERHIKEELKKQNALRSGSGGGGDGEVMRVGMHFC